MDNLFRPLHPAEVVRTSYRHLPHWEQDGASYFVTFRTADSLPAERLEEMKNHRDLWLRLHPPPWSQDLYDEYGRLMFQKLDSWLDQEYGACVLRRPQLSSIVEKALLHFDGVRYHLDESVIMPNHGHTLFKPIGDWRLSQILQSWKSYSAHRINEVLERSGQFWFHESYDRLVRNRAELERIREYIRNNPVSAGLVSGEYRLFRGGGIK